jgi:4-amino-4-deoxy-L-arabinose transferase-like glycosyltransferase
MASKRGSTGEIKSNSGGRPSWPSIVVLALLLGVALLLRWRYVQEISLFVDEFVTAWAAQNVLERGLPIFPSGNIYPHGFLFTYLVAPFLLGGFDEVLVRVPALLVSLAALPVAYLAGRRLLSEEAGLVAAAAMAVDPDLIVWGGRARMYGLLQLLVLLAIYFYYRGLTGGEGRDRTRHRYLGMGLLVAAIFTHAEAIFLLPVLGLATLVALPWRRLLRPDIVLPFVIGGLGAVAFFLIAKYGQPNHLETLEREGRGYLELSADLLAGPLAFGPAVAAPHRLAFSLLALLGIALLFRPRFERGSALTYLYVVVGGLLGLLITLAGASWHRERYLFLVLPLLFLIGGQVLAHVAGRLRLPVLARRWLPAALALVVALYVGLAGTHRAFVQEWGYDLAFRYLQDNWQPDAGDRLATSMSTAALLYVGHNDAFAIQEGYEEYVVARSGDGLPADLWTATPVLTTTAAFLDLLQESPRLWFVVDGWRFQTRYEHDFILNVMEQMDLAWNQRGVLVFRGQGYSALPTPGFQRARRAEFEDQMALTGFALSDLNPAPGDELEVLLRWQALPAAGPAYTALLHLVADDGSGLAGVDEPVLQGLYQPDLWPRGQTLPDRHLLQLPAGLAPGRYRLDLGLYTPGQVEAPLLAAGQDRVPLAAIDVGPVPSQAPDEALDVDFDGVRLLGYDLACEGQPPACGLVLHWQASRPLDRDYTVFVHLVDGQGTIVDQDDAPPGGPFLPTTAWLPGQVLRSGHTLALPAGARAGDYALLAGLYHRPTDERLRAVGPGGQDLGDALPLATMPLAGSSP